MQAQDDGRCSECGTRLTEAWLTLHGEALCPSCARRRLDTSSVRVTAGGEQDNRGR